MNLPIRARRFSLASLVLLLGLPVAASAENWPSLRGPEATGVAPGANPPLEWAEDRNVLWKVEIGGTGHASPVVWGKQIWMTNAPSSMSPQ